MEILCKKLKFWLTLQINLRVSSISRDYSIVVCQPLIVDTPSLSTVAFSQAGSILLAENFNPAVRWTLYFFPRVILYNFFLFWLIYGGLGFGVLGLRSYIEF